jgi:dihydrofolate synthase / folylpolyglutamate synthase
MIKCFPIYILIVASDAYRGGIAFLDSLSMFGSRPGLGRIGALLSAMGNPENSMKIVLVGGSSGKGSTSAALSSILTASGLKTGLFSKPHFYRFGERIRINGEMIGDADCGRLLIGIKKLCPEVEKSGLGHPTFFEAAVACALAYFCEKKVDVAVMEVGLGGRFDATNACNPELSIITNVSMEHAEVLGDTIPKIASEKAGITREGKSVITGAEGEALHALLSLCAQNGANLLKVGPDIALSNIKASEKGTQFDFHFGAHPMRGLFVPLAGSYQARNAACAATAAVLLSESYPQITEDAIRSGLMNAKWPGRMEMVSSSPQIVIDCAKDPHSMELSLSEMKKIHHMDKWVIVSSISSDKDWHSMLVQMAKFASRAFFFAHGVGSRAVPPDALAEHMRELGVESAACSSVQDAISRAKESAGPGGLVLVTGSVFGAADARRVFIGAEGSEQNLNESPPKKVGA